MKSQNVQHLISTPKVSVIIPAYNVERFISKCLESLVNQTLKDLEIIVINDGSTDNTLSVINNYALADQRIKVFTQENKGQSAARNYGIRIAKGEYIGFVDSDDWVEFDYYEKLYSAAVKHSADIAAGGFIRVGKICSLKKINYENSVLYTEPSEKIRAGYIPRYNYVWNKIYKREALLTLNWAFPEGMAYEDIYWTAKIVYYLNGLVTVPDTFYYYRRNNGSTVTKRSDKLRNDNIKAYRELFLFLQEHNIKNIMPCATGKKDKTKILGLEILRKEYVYPNIEIYKLFGLIKLITVEKSELIQIF